MDIVSIEVLRQVDGDWRAVIKLEGGGTIEIVRPSPALAWAFAKHYAENMAEWGGE
jgi:hypothetical protein